MRAIVLGSAAGGGSPQWNCRCGVCERVRRGDPGTAPRTQTSLAVSADDRRWAIIDASPDLRQQVLTQPALWPAQPGRHSPIAAMVVTSGDIDRVAGLLSLRERHAFSLYGTDLLHETLADSPLFAVLDPELVPRRKLTLDLATPLVDASGDDLGILVEPFVVPGKIPLYLEKRGTVPDTRERTARTIGLRIHARGTKRSLFYVPSCAELPPDLARRLDGAELLLFDGTLFRDDELVMQGLGEKTGRRMGHMSLDGPDGTLAAFASLRIGRKVLVHINNSNPVLLGDSGPRRRVEAAGWEVAFDGMELAP